MLKHGVTVENSNESKQLLYDVFFFNGGQYSRCFISQLPFKKAVVTACIL